ncbi:MAG: 2-amino-4-hydroxy-6-hydroxymethyldihydropteridine diphosphokinase [Acidobacteria bacterium]|nr:MAG: 2-amino-4-hydroxy-6-hydroxymethyldihydropteridine diphosphokinase [Acidobacteriota bacterium]
MKSRRRSKRKSAEKTRRPTRTRSSKPTGRKRKSSKGGGRRRARVAYLGLGSNLGDRRAHLEAALREIAGFAPLRKVSSFYQTEPVGFRDQPDFWNVVVEISWSGTPRGLLEKTRRVERRVGRTSTFANGPREIDVDILDFAGRLRETGDPILPHPRLSGRRFALAPLAEINPSWSDPRSGRGVADLLRALPKAPRVRRIAPRRSGARSPRR